MKIVKVILEVEVPFDATDDQIREWIEFETNGRSDIHCDNPFLNIELRTRGCTIVDM
jgi:hypothetical protein